MTCKNPACDKPQGTLSEYCSMACVESDQQERLLADEVTL